MKIPSLNYSLKTVQVARNLRNLVIRNPRNLTLLLARSKRIVVWMTKARTHGPLVSFMLRLTCSWARNSRQTVLTRLDPRVLKISMWGRDQICSCNDMWVIKIPHSSPWSWLNLWSLVEPLNEQVEPTPPTLNFDTKKGAASGVMQKQLAKPRQRFLTSRQMQLDLSTLRVQQEVTLQPLMKTATSSVAALRNQWLSTK